MLNLLVVIFKIICGVFMLSTVAAILSEAAKDETKGWYMDNNGQLKSY